MIQAAVDRHATDRRADGSQWTRRREDRAKNRAAKFAERKITAAQKP